MRFATKAQARTTRERSHSGAPQRSRGEPGIHEHGLRSMDSGLAATRRPGMTAEALYWKLLQRRRENSPV
jgi:hypothetical protein